MPSNYHHHVNAINSSFGDFTEAFEASSGTRSPLFHASLGTLQLWAVSKARGAFMLRFYCSFSVVVTHVPLVLHSPSWKRRWLTSFHLSATTLTQLSGFVFWYVKSLLKKREGRSHHPNVLLLFFLSLPTSVVVVDDGCCCGVSELRPVLLTLFNNKKPNSRSKKAKQ